MMGFKSDFQKNTDVPFMNISGLLIVVEALQKLGIPTEKYAEKSGVPLAYLDQPEAVIPVILAGRFADLLAHKEGVEDLGFCIGLKCNALQNFGAYSARIRSAPTCLTYLYLAAQLYGTTITGVKLWISRDETGVHFNMHYPGLREGWGIHPALFTLATSINTLSAISGGSWVPKRIKLPHGINIGRTGEDQMNGIPVVHWDGPISFLVGKSLLAQTIDTAIGAVDGAQKTMPLPASFSDSVENTVRMLLEDGRCSLENTSHALGLQPRTLQRRMQREGRSFGELAAGQRHRMAVSMLRDSDLSVTDIAFQLGFSDTSNFTRAFRKLAGYPPVSLR